MIARLPKLKKLCLSEIKGEDLPGELGHLKKSEVKDGFVVYKKAETGDNL